MRRIKLLISFDGTGYAGWQRQNNALTVQGEIEKSISRIVGGQVTIHGAGRTDAGVHARGMVAHVDVPVSIPLAAFARGLNSMLPPAVRILSAEEVSPSFHARYSAISKVYTYCFSVSSVMDPVRRHYCAHIHGISRWEEMDQCLALVVGEHDFSSFEATGSRDQTRVGGRGACRHILSASVKACPLRADEYIIEIQGDGFLRKMVRNIVGTVFLVGKGRMSVAAFVEVLDKKNREYGGPTAPACGLFLEKVHYDNEV